MVKITGFYCPQLSLDSLLKRYENKRRLEKLEPIYRATLAEAESLSEPVAMYEEFPLAEVPELSEWLLPETISVVLALCTFGLRLEARIKELSQDDLVTAVVLDEIALAYVTAVARLLPDTIRKQAQERGLKAGPAYQPGLGRWSLETQSTIFAHLPADAIGVTLNAHMLMTPIKTTSLIIPLIDRKNNGRRPAR